MSRPFAIRIQSIPWMVTDGIRMLRARVRGEPERRTAVAEFVKKNAAQGDAEAVLRALDDFGRNRRFLMNVGDEKAPLLEEAVRTAGRSAQILELGAYVGYSAIVMARLLGSGGKVTSIEASADSVRIASEIVAYAGVADRVQIIHGKSGDRIPELSGPFDVVFLDHWKGLYTEDLQSIERHGLLRPGSVVIADNVGPFFDARKYLDYVRGCGRYESRNVKSHIEYQTVEDAVEISVWKAESPE